MLLSQCKHAATKRATAGGNCGRVPRGVKSCTKQNDKHRFLQTRRQLDPACLLLTLGIKEESYAKRHSVILSAQKCDCMATAAMATAATAAMAARAVDPPFGPASAELAEVQCKVK